MNTASARSILEEVAAAVLANLPALQQRRYEITWKDDGSPVTQADLFVESLVEGILRARIGAFDLISEEMYVPSAAERKPTVVVLDPIDGTENFCSGLKEWGVSIGIWHAGTHCASMLLLPELGDRLITGDTIPKIRSRISGFSSSFVSEIGAGIASVREARIMGCAVYNLYNVARGAFARFSNPKGAYIWDLLPGLMLAQEHGCHILVDDGVFDGSFLDPDRRYRVDIRRGHDPDPGQGAVG